MYDGENWVLVSQLGNSVVRMVFVLPLELLEEAVVVSTWETGEMGEMREGGRERECVRGRGRAKWAMCNVFEDQRF